LTYGASHTGQTRNGLALAFPDEVKPYKKVKTAKQPETGAKGTP